MFLPATSGPAKKGWDTNKINKIIKKIFFSFIIKKIFFFKSRVIIIMNKRPKLKSGKNKNFIISKYQNLFEKNQIDQKIVNYKIH